MLIVNKCFFQDFSQVSSFSKQITINLANISSSVGEDEGSGTTSVLIPNTGYLHELYKIYSLIPYTYNSNDVPVTALIGVL